LLLVNGLVGLAWAEEERMHQSWLALAEFGFDLEQLDGIRARNSQPLSSKDRGPMAALQTVVDQWDENQFQAIPSLSLIELLADTSNSVCRRVTMVGRVRQCLRIQTDSNPVDSASPTGLFQLTIFPELDGQQINVRTSKGERISYGRFPVTVRASVLPGQETEKSLLNKMVRVDGFHYRFWSFDSEFANQRGMKGQIGALVIAGPVKRLKTPSLAILSKGLMGWLSVLAVGLLVMGWWYGRRWPESGHQHDALPEKLPDDWNVD
jgi:hypothetical protein